ncbi:Tolloid-like protein 2 [Elysia marginata]|uniref:Tolloid-like protein 2 n=1 Tax=Elysia marginata TaxID=1093978 RepID=A0AAV4HUG7_9GAST|nr:Tolloid-like protein 2 [Elysia marginata]
MTQKIGQYCGSATTKDIKTKGQNLKILFTSDDTINWKGFSATYQLISPQPDFPASGTGESNPDDSSGH